MNQETAPRTLEIRRLGRVPYQEGLETQDELVRKRRAGEVPDTLLLLEHPHVITMGTATTPENILADDAELARLGIRLHEAGRGGNVTYHGPGQLVGYPILDLKPDRKDLHRYLRDLEEVLLRTLVRFGIAGERSEGRTGVWTPSGKIAAIGVRVSSGWITSHGFALNVHTDLAYFETIVPCGLSDRRVTSMAGELARPVSLDEVAGPLTETFRDVFGGRS